MNRERPNSAAPDIADVGVTSMPRHLDWEKGGHACVERLDSDAIVLRSTTSAPPGARLVARLALEPSIVVHVKSHGSRRDADGTFVLKGRLIDATRPLREQLAELAVGSPSERPGGA